MRYKEVIFSFAAVGVIVVGGLCSGGSEMVLQTVQLPEPAAKGEMSLEEAIGNRRSRRAFSNRPLSLDQVSQLLWSAQGITGGRGGKRAAPSAGATYPVELFVAVGKGSVAGLETGIYRYVPSRHVLSRTGTEDVRAKVASAALGQQFLAEAPVDLLIAADYKRTTTARYGERGIRYVHMEIGHVSQNIYLQAEALGLGTVAVGAFRDERVAKTFGLSADLAPLCLMPLGYTR